MYFYDLGINVITIMRDYPYTYYKYSYKNYYQYFNGTFLLLGNHMAGKVNADAQVLLHLLKKFDDVCLWPGGFSAQIIWRSIPSK